MSNNRQPDSFRSIVQRAMERPMAVLAVIVVVSLLLSAIYGGWILVLGAAACVWLLYSSPKASQEFRGMLGPARVSQGAADPDLSRLQGKYHASMERALATRRNIERAIADSRDPGVRRALTDSTRDLPELTATIYDLAIKAQSVQSSMQSSNTVATLTDEIKRLEREIAATNDEFLKGQYYAALDGKLQQMQNMTDTRVAVSRWDAQIDNALSTLDTLLSQVLRIKSSEVLSYEGATDQLSHDLKEEVESLKATSDALDSVYGWGKKEL
jgi:hypothetical protein